MTRPRPIRGFHPAFLLATAAVLTTAGCYQGFTGTVSSQPPTGNGTDFLVGAVAVQNTTIVAGEGDSAAFSFTMINNSETPDQLLSVTTTPESKVVLEGPVELTPKVAVQVGGPTNVSLQVAGLPVPAGSYAEVTFNFKEAGSTTQQIAVVPNVGYYASYGPSAPAKPAVTEKAAAAASAKASEKAAGE